MALFDIFRPKWKRSNHHVRWDAVQKITDQSILFEIAKTDKDSFVCASAIKRISDCKMLNELLECNMTWFCKKEVIRAITGNNLDWYSLHKIHDDHLLSIVAKESDSDPEVKSALEEIKDAKLFAEIILSNPAKFSFAGVMIYSKTKDEDLINSVLKVTIGSLSYFELKERIKSCPFCNSQDISWDESKYTQRGSGPADSFYRETITLSSEETIYKLICKSCNTILVEGDTGD